MFFGSEWCVYLMLESSNLVVMTLSSSSLVDSNTVGLPRMSRIVIWSPSIFAYIMSSATFSPSRKTLNSHISCRSPLGVLVPLTGLLRLFLMLWLLLLS